MSTIARDFGHITKTIVYNSTVKVAKDLYAVGVIRGMYKIYSITGFEKLTKVIIADIKLLAHIEGTKGIFAKFMESLEAQKNIYYATMFLDGVITFIDVKTLKFRIAGENCLDKTSRVLLAIGNFCETGKFLQKQGIFKFETCTQIANKLGSFKVNIPLPTLNGFKSTEIHPFTHRPISALCNNPKDLFIFTASILDILNLAIKLWKTRAIEDDTQRHKTQRKKVLSPANLLKVSGSCGKIGLIWFGRSSNTLAFALLDFVTQNASLAAFFIKVHNEKKIADKKARGAAAA